MENGGSGLSAQDCDRPRRRFLNRMLLVGVGTVVYGTWSTSCGPGGPSAEEVARQVERYDPDLDCTDTSDLFEAERQIREDNEYVPVSDHETQRCFNCSFFREADDRSACGTCETVPGPIHPLGRCKAWVYRR